MNDIRTDSEVGTTLRESQEVLHWANALTYQGRVVLRGRRVVHLLLPSVQRERMRHRPKTAVSAIGGVFKSARSTGTADSGGSTEPWRRAAGSGERLRRESPW